MIIVRLVEKNNTPTLETSELSGFFFAQINKNCCYMMTADVSYGDFFDLPRATRAKRPRTYTHCTCSRYAVKYYYNST